jgi:hypothetical protein
VTQIERSSRKVISGSGWANPLSHSFYLENSSHLKVYSNVADVLEQLTLGVDYSVSGVGDDNGYEVTITTPGDWDPTSWVLSVEPPIDQPADISLGGTFGERFEAALDRVSNRIQHVYDMASRAIKSPLSTDPDELVQDDLVVDPAILNDFETSAAAVIAAAEAAQAAAAASAVSAQSSEDDAEIAETNAETAQTNAETAQAAALVAQAAAELAAASLPAIVANTMLVDNAAGNARETKTFAQVRTALSVLPSIDEDDFASNSAAAVPTQQSVKAYVDTSIAASHRVLLTANRTYYVRTDGSDSNTGLVDSAGGAFLTLQKAYTVIRDTLDLAGYTATIKAADGTYTAGLVINGQLTGAGSTPLILEGNTTTPANAILSTTSASGVIVGKGGYIKVRGFKLQTTTSGSGVIAYDGGQIEYDTVDFGACAQYHNVAYNAGRITPSGNYTISGNALGHWHCYQEGVYLVGAYTITLSGTPAFAGAFAACAFGNIGVSASCVFSGSATGKRYLVHKGGLIDVSAQGETFLPGNAAGEAYENGLYVGSQSMGVVQSVIGTYATNAALSTVVPLDDTIPQNTEGTEIISVNITPRSPYSKLRCTFVGQAAGSVTGIFMVAAIFKNSDADAIHAIPVAAPTNNYPVTLHGIVEFTPSSVAQQTIAVRAGPSSNSMRFNGNTAARFYGGAAKATLLVEEIATAVP